LNVPPIPVSTIAETGLQVTQLGLGTAGLGDLFATVPEAEAQAIAQQAWDCGVRYYDTAPWYGKGKSEHRIGTFLRQQPRHEFVLSTKVGRVLRAPANPDHTDPRGPWTGALPFDLYFDYGYDGIMRSWEDSLQRLSVSRVDILFIHDLDHLYFGSDEGVSAHLGQLYTSGWRALDELRRSGRVGAIGAGINRANMMPRFLDLVDLDLFLVAMPYTLLDQDVLDDIFPRCAEQGVQIVIGAPFASGILATGAVDGATYDYAPATTRILEKTRAIQRICENHHTPLQAVALQFPVAHPLVVAAIPGATEAAHVQANVENYAVEVPADLWSELKTAGLLRADAPTPGVE